MQHKTFVDCVRGNFLEHWGNVAENKKPIIAAVNGFAVSRCPVKLQVIIT